jgi:hypothetical protein
MRVLMRSLHCSVMHREGYSPIKYKTRLSAGLPLTIRRTNGKVRDSLQSGKSSAVDGSLTKEAASYWLLAPSKGLIPGIARDAVQENAQAGVPVPQEPVPLLKPTPIWDGLG